MRLRTLFAIVLTMCALPALASDPARLRWREPQKPTPNVDTLVAIADVQLDAAADETTAPGTRKALLDDARDGYRLALDTDPKHKGALLGFARYYARTEQRVFAVETYKKYLTLYPTDADAAHELAVAHAKWQDWSGAVAWCEHALKIDPANRTAQKTMGFCLARAEKWDEAFAMLCRVMSEAEARHNLAGLLDHAGRTGAAQEQLRLALKADPSHAPARDLLRELETAAAPRPREAPVLITKTFYVADIYNRDVGLRRLITNTVRPASWDCNGGRGCAEYHDAGCSLVVRNTPAIVAEVGELLEALHRVAGPKVPPADHPGLFPVTVTEGSGIADAAVKVPVPFSAYKLKRASAAMVADVVAVFIRDKGPDARVTYDVANNCVFFSAEPALVKQINELLAVLDKEPVAVAAGEEKPLPPDAASAGEPKPLPFASGRAIGVFASGGLVVKWSRDPWYKPAPAVAPVWAVYKLRNIAATDAASALNTFASEKKLAVTLAAEPVSNSVHVSAEPAIQKQLGEMLAKLDQEPAQIVAKVMVVRVPRGFAERAGLNVGAKEPANVWALSPREAHMLANLLAAAKDKGELEVLTRPLLQVCDGQTGRVHVGQERAVVTGFEVKTAGETASVEKVMKMVPVGVAVELTPRLSPDGKSVLLNVDFRQTEEKGERKVPLAVAVNGEMLQAAQFVTVPAFATSAVRVNAELKLGHTLVLAAGRGACGPLAGTCGGDKFETLLFVTPEIVKSPEPARPAGGWFLK